MPSLLRKTRAALLGQLELVRATIEQKDEDLCFETRIDQFENQQTLAEIEACLNSLDSKGQLVEVLSNRWDRIRDSSMSYTQSPFNPVNRFCLQVAGELCPLPRNEEDINQLGEREGPYFLMMPSLMRSQDIYGNNIHLLNLHEFILSDSAQVYIPVKCCLENASNSNAFYHMVSENSMDYPLLSATEMKRLADHSVYADDYVGAIRNYHEQSKNEDHLGGQLERLKNALRAGGAHAAGEEYNAGSAANLGIFKFSQYWSGLPLEQQQRYLREYPDLEEPLGRLFRPDNADYQQVRYCVELIASDLEDVIFEMGEERLELQNCQESMSESKRIFEMELSRPNTYSIRLRHKAPNNLLMIHQQLNAEQQRQLFEGTGCMNAWTYVLKERPQEVVKFKKVLTTEMREAVSRSRFPGGLTSLMMAVKADCGEAINILLDCDAALLDQREDSGKTALMLAVEEGNLPLFNLLLAKDVNVSIRDFRRSNTLDKVVDLHPEMLIPLLLKIASLDSDQQNEIFHDGFNPTNVWTYTLMNHSALLPTLFEQMIEQNNLQVLRERHELTSIFRMPRLRQGTTLMVAILSRNVNLVRLVLDRLPEALGCSPMDLLTETDFYNEVALSWAAHEGHVDMVNLLLDRGAVIDRPGHAGFTALHWAVKKGHREVTLCLLGRGVNLNLRDNNGENALDLALRLHPASVAPLLSHAATLNAEEQREVLAGVEGLYSTVIEYVFHERLELWQEIRQNPDLLISQELREISRETLSRLMEAERDFKVRLDDLMDKYQEFLERKEEQASEVTLQLHNELKREGENFFKEPTLTNFHTFRDNCNLALDAARPVLESHREYTYYFANFALFFVGCGALYLINKVITGNFFFFPPTESAKKMNAIHDVIDQWEVKFQ